VLEETAGDATPLERELAVLARASCREARRLSPAHLEPLRRLAGDGALEYALVVGQFHYMTRIADLLGVEPELPAPVRRFGWLRRLGIKAFGAAVSRWDLAGRDYRGTADDAVAALRSPYQALTGRALGGELAPVAPRPAIVEYLRLGIEDLVARSSLDRATVARVSALVEQALPDGEQDVQGIHPRPQDPVEAFAFVGTRYAYRTTAKMVDALRGRGLDDRGILDLAVAVATANQWARLGRLVGAEILPATATAPSS